MSSSVSTLIRPMTNFANAPASRTPTDMLLAVWNAEVISAFSPALTLSNRLRNVTISSGREAFFPMTWKIGSETHEAGSELLGQDVETSRVRIDLEDRPLTTSYYTDDIDYLLTQADVRGEVSRQMGLELAKQAEIRAFSLLVNAALTDPGWTTNSSFPGRVNAFNVSNGDYSNAAIDDIRASGVPSSANCQAVTNALLEALDAIGLAWDDLDIPKENRMVCVEETVMLACRKYGLTPVGVSGFTMGAPGSNPFGAPPIQQVYTYDAEFDYNGWRIFCAPQATWNTNTTTGPTKWRNNASGVYALAFTPDAVGWVSYMNVMTETQRIAPRRQNFISSAVMHGGGTLRPYCSVVISN